MYAQCGRNSYGWQMRKKTPQLASEQNDIGKRRVKKEMDVRAASQTDPKIKSSVIDFSSVSLFRLELIGSVRVQPVFSLVLTFFRLINNGNDKKSFEV